MKKITEKQFIDWHDSIFPYGYGTGEAIILPALHTFFSSLENGRMYNYEILEEKIGKEATWFLINILAKADVIEYGTSPRFAWIQDDIGPIAQLRDFIVSHKPEELYELVTGTTEEYFWCQKGNCQCDNPECQLLLKFT